MTGGAYICIREMVIYDEHDLSHRASGWILRAAGGVDRQRLLDVSETYFADVPPIALRYATEDLDKEQRDRYLGMKKQQNM